MEICHVITSIERGGAEKQLLLLAKKQVESGLHVSIIYLKGNPDLRELMERAGINILEEFAEKNFFSQVRMLRKYQKRNPAVIVHAHLPRSELLCALSLRRKSFVATRHNSEQFFPKAPKLISVLLSNFVALRTFKLISISQSVSSFLRQNHEVPFWIHDSVIYYGFKTSRVAQNREFRKLERVKFGTISRLVPQKNLQLMLELLLAFREAYKIPCTLEIVGEGFQEHYLKNLSQELGISQNVHWSGKISDVDRFYRDINLFILTSRYEGFGLVLLEAMSHNIPIIAAANSAILEVLSEEHPGLVYTDSPTKFAEKIHLLLTNQETYNRAIEIQKKQLNTFTIENTYRAHIQIYTQLTKLSDAD